MKTIQILFNNTGYEPFIDFLKAYAIICVLIGHTFPHVDKIGYPLWIGMQVPIFVLIQAYHVLKRPSYKLDLKKIFLRILLPYAIVLSGIILVYIFSGNFNKQQITIGLISGGYGPGSYYPWIYIQIAILFHFIHPIFNKINIGKQAIMWIAICEGFEILESCVSLPNFIHRLLAIRYLFLIYLAWRWVIEGIVINKSTIFISLLSGLSIAYFFYCNFDNEPFFYNTGWNYHRWPCYYYVSTLFCYLLYLVYCKVYLHKLINKLFKFLAKCSYEIFLIQLAVITILPQFSFIENKYIAYIYWIIVVWITSLAGGYLFNIVYSKFLKRIS